MNMYRNLLVLDIGGTKVAGGIVTLISDAESTTLSEVLRTSGKEYAPGVFLHTESAIATRAKEGGEQVATRVARFAQNLQQQAENMGFPVTIVGVSSAGVIDPHTKQVVSATNIMPGWGGIELGQILQTAINLPVEILNDVYAHALGESTWGAAHGHNNVCVMAVGTGIGGAIIANGELQWGAHLLAGHLGHVTYQNGPYFPCSCGRVGHVEAIASGSGVAQLYNHLLSADALSKTHGDKVHGGFEVYTRSLEGDVIAQKALRISAQALGQALGNLANCLDPHLIVLSGSMTRSGDIWWESLRTGYLSQAMNPAAAIPIVSGTLEGAAPLLGAAAFALTQNQL